MGLIKCAVLNVPTVGMVECSFVVKNEQVTAAVVLDRYERPLSMERYKEEWPKEWPLIEKAMIAYKKPDTQNVEGAMDVLLGALFIGGIYYLMAQVAWWVA